MNLRCRIVATLLGCGLSLSALAAVTATLDRDQVEDGETVQLTLLRDGRSSTKPDLAPLKRDFDILGSSSGSSIQLINGSVSAKGQFRLTLSPKRRGRIEIPSLQWDGQASPVLELIVAEAAGGDASDRATTAPSSQVFLTSSLDTPRPYVQAAVVLTVRLYVGQPLAQATLELPASDDLLVQQLGKDRQTRETRNGRQYEVVERKYLLLPQRSGTLKLEGPVLDAQVQERSQMDPFGGAFGNLMGNTRPMRLHGDPIVLEVRPRPAAATGREWLPARRVTLEETWKPADADVRVGEPLTRHLKLSAEGLTAAQLPDLSSLIRTPDGLKGYPDQAKLDNGQQNDTLVGSREQDIALIASRPGRYELPELRLSWWDTGADVQREITLSARSLEVLPAAASAGEPAPAPTVLAAPAAPPAASNPSKSEPLVAGPLAAPSGVPWPWISLALGLLWSGTVAAWWIRARRRTRVVQAVAVTASPSIPAATALKAFREACRNHDARAARLHLLDWARATWPEQPPVGLNALALRLEDRHLAGLIEQLDRACYVGGPWQGEELARAALPVAAKPSGKAPVLAGLYP